MTVLRPMANWLMTVQFQTSKWYAEEPRQTAVVGVELVANLVVLGLATVSLLVLPSLK